MSRFNDEDRRFEQTDLMAERLAERRKSHLCLDVRSPEYSGPDEDEAEEGRTYAFAERHRARQLAARLDKGQVAGLVAESLRVMLAAYDAEDCVTPEQLDQVRVNLAAWDLVKDKP